MRVAAFQRLAVFDAVEAAGDALARDLAWADENGAGIAVFPESYLQGHSYDRDLIKRRGLFLDDGQIAALLDRLRPFRTTAIIGFFERRADGIYNSAMVVRGGALLGVYAKANPIEPGCECGADFPVWHAGRCRFGVTICSDMRKPEIAGRIADQGADLLCCPHNMMLRPTKVSYWREPCIKALQDCARRTGCWVVSSDVVGTNPAGWVSYGCTAIIDPSGTVVARVPEFIEGVAMFDLPIHTKKAPSAEADRASSVPIKLHYIQ